MFSAARCGQCLDSTRSSRWRASALELPRFRRERIQAIPYILVKAIDDCARNAGRSVDGIEPHNRCLDVRQIRAQVFRNVLIHRARDHVAVKRFRSGNGVAADP